MLATGETRGVRFEKSSPDGAIDKLSAAPSGLGRFMHRTTGFARG